MSAVILPMPNVPAASPQVEDGYTRISNELLGALVLADLSKQQWEVLMAIIRKTYGFNKTEDDIALSQLSTMTDGDRGNHSRVINSLVERRILNRAKGRHSFTLGLNKDYSQWGLKNGRSELVRTHWRGVSAAPAVVTPTTVNEDRGCKSYNSAVVEPTTLLLSDLQPQKTTPKETIKRQKEENTCAPQADRGESFDDARADQEDRAVTASESTRAGRKGRAMTVLTAEQLVRFEKFYDAYPRKRSRIAAEKAFAKLNPDDALLADLLTGVERSKLTAQWSDPTKIPHPSSWLNAGAWEDDIETAYGAREREVIDSFNETLGAAMGEIDPSIFSERRAGAIRTFLRLSDKPEFWTRFFPWIRDNCILPPQAGFDWLISPDGFSKVRGGQFSKEQR